MKSIWVVAENTFKEIIRDRILYGLLVFAVLFMGLSLVLGQLSFAETLRISTNLGLAGMHLSCVVLSIFVGASLVFKELEKRTALTVLARAISRPQFLIAKYLGLFLVLVLMVALLSGLLGGVLMFLGLEISSTYLGTIMGMLMEASILLGWAIFLGTFMKPFLTISVSLGIFLIGHWQRDLLFFAEKGESPVFLTFAKVVHWVVPDLERFNWRSFVTYGDTLAAQEVLLSLAYSLGWVFVLMGLASLVFQRRDLV